MRDIKYGEELLLKGMRHTSVEPIKIKFIDAGHILGSAGVFIEHQQNTMFYTGDINLGDQSIMKGANLDEIKNIDTLILETTYGATDSEKLGTWQSELLRLAKSANKVLNKGGSILIPVFALGKTQEILASIYYLIKKRKLTDTNIYTGGVSKHISRIYDRNKYLVNRYETNFEFSDIKQIDLFDVDDFNQFKKNPGIVLASSGMMLEGTASFKLADYWLKQENFAVFCVGYMDENTPGFKVVNSKKGDVIQLGEFGKPFKIKCGVERLYFTSHSKREDLLQIVANSKPKRVILVHGDYSSKDWIGYNILQKHSNIKINSAEVGKSIYID
jgi:Cft2 family RNA processing exonuclease